MVQLSLPSHSDCSINRCKKYLPSVKREARFFIGFDAPYHYFLGQIEQESGCNEGITAFDGGMGLGQFMPQTAEWIHEREDALKEFPLNPYDPRWAIRALILYDRWCYDNTLCKGWYYAFRGYNGGVGILNKEIRLASSCNRETVEGFCKRKIIRLKNNRTLNMCDVNISYPERIFRKSEKYKEVLN